MFIKVTPKYFRVLLVAFSSMFTVHLVLHPAGIYKTRLICISSCLKLVSLYSVFFNIDVKTESPPRTSAVFPSLFFFLYCNDRISKSIEKIIFSLKQFVL